MKKLIACAATALLLSGCGPASPAPAPTAPATHEVGYGTTSVFDIDVRGRKVTCIAWKVGSSAGGLSCDWANAK